MKFKPIRERLLASSMICGVAMLAATEAGITVVEYTPAEIKRSVVGYGRAEKAQVGQMVKLLLGLDAVPTPHDAADALAVETHGRNVERDRMTKRRLARTSLVHDTIRTLAGPLHLIVGERDFIFEGRWDQAHALLDEVPALQSRLLIEGAGHWVSYEAADRYNAAVLRLLKDLPNASL